MLTNSNIVAFVATSNAEEALRFYRDTLGLLLIEDSPFALVFDANGVTLRIAKIERLTPARHTVLGWEVYDIGEAVRGLTMRGIRFERFPGMSQDELGIWTSPDGAKVAWFKDPDGNALSLTHNKP